MTRRVGFSSLTVAPWTGTLLAPRVISSLTALDTCCSATPARYRVRSDAISRFPKTSRSLLWRIVKFAVTQMPSIHELDRVSDQHDVAFYWHVSQRCHRPAHWSQLMIGTMEPPRDRHIEASP